MIGIKDLIILLLFIVIVGSILFGSIGNFAATVSGIVNSISGTINSNEGYVYDGGYIDSQNQNTNNANNGDYYSSPDNSNSQSQQQSSSQSSSASKSSSSQSSKSTKVNTNLNYTQAEKIVNDHIEQTGYYAGGGYYSNGYWYFKIYDSSGNVVDGMSVNDKTGATERV